MTIFIRLVGHKDKASALSDAVSSLRDGMFYSNVYFANPTSFVHIPGNPFAYWVSDRIRQIFGELPAFASKDRTAQHGLSTKKDPRFVRAWWEVIPENLVIGTPDTSPSDFQQQTFMNRYWVHFAKGGGYSPYYADLHLVVNWRNNGNEIEQYVLNKYPYLKGNANWILHRECSYFVAGLTWSRRTTSSMSVRVLASGALFGDKGPTAFMKADERFLILAIMNSTVFQGLVALQLAAADTAARSYEVGLIQTTPIVNITSANENELIDFSLQHINLKRGFDTNNDLSHLYWLPCLLQVTGETLAARIDAYQREVSDSEVQIDVYEDKINDIAFNLYNLNKEDRYAIEISLKEAEPNEKIGAEPMDEPLNELDDDEEHYTNADYTFFISDLAFYCVGAAFGRWDLRCATGERLRPELPDPFAPLPAYSPGMLQPNNSGIIPTQYAVGNTRFTTRPILVDDPGHPSDIVTAVREVLAIIFAERADAIYQEIVDALVGSGHDLRPWLRTTFFEEHIKRYSKSRRKAPIYWCFTTVSRRYAVWLYYHRFSRDTLYTVLNDLSLKVEHEVRQLNQLHAQVGANPNATQRNELESQVDFVEELQNLRDEVKKVAPLWHPDLNDGVIINFAPLWRLAPWPRRWQQECQQIWEALCHGEYDWAHLTMHLWPERVIPKCQNDRSLAIAHGLDEVFWSEPATGKAQPRSVDPAAVQALIAERSSAALVDALASLQEAPPITHKVIKQPAQPKGKRTRRSRSTPEMQQAAMDFSEGDGE